MSRRTDLPVPRPPFPDLRVFKDSLRRGALLVVSPLAAYTFVRPMVSSEVLALAIAAAIPVLYSLAHAVARHRVDPLAGLSALGFSVACLISVLAGGSSLPLKLHEAFITFGIGLVIIAAALIRRPLPIARLLRTPDCDRSLDSTLSAIIGSFLILHALLHLALAVSLSTSAYLLAGRIINLGTIAVGVLALSVYLRKKLELK